jgi:acylphosphatase
MACRLYRVSGRVQGVFFRDSTRTQAGKLGINGYARNMPDGTVEVMACGDERSVAQLAEWLWQGSPMSAVENVECLGDADYDGNGFRTA